MNIANCLRGTVFDYYVDEPSCSMVHWESRVTPFIYQPGNFASNFVPTVETTRIAYLLELLISRNTYVMLVGNTGMTATLLLQTQCSSLVVDKK